MIAPRLSWPTTWNEFLPMSMPITAIWALAVLGMGGLLLMQPQPSVARWRGRSTAGPSYYRTPHVFTDAEMGLAVTIARQLGFAFERMRAEEHRKQAEEAKELLLNESRHRIKNTLATVQAIAGQTLRDIPSGQQEAFLARLHALGEAHELLTSGDWHQAILPDVVRRALKPFESPKQNRFTHQGPALWVPAPTSLSLTLCLHELATNAAKYGALSNGAGQVHVAWEPVGPDKARLSWRETGGPAVVAPQRTGFGSRLIESSNGTGEPC